MKPRQLVGPDRLLHQIVGVGLIALQLYFLYLRPISPHLHGVIFLTGVMLLTFLRNPGWSRRLRYEDRVHPLDYLLCVAAVVPLVYILSDFAAFARRGSVPRPTDIWIGILFIVLLVEAGRRVLGWILPALAVLAIAIILSALVLPEVLHIAPRISLRRTIGALFQTELGIFAEPTQVALRWIFVFLVFGQCLMLSGGKDFFMQVGMAIAGRVRGGPGYMSVVTSALFGSLSGSNMANVMVTGQFSIPWMIRAGYTRRQAGAIESVASTAGALTPPIMGAGALIMAEYTATPYSTVIAAALLPSLLYYTSLLAYVFSITRRLGLERVEMPKTDPVWTLALRYWPVLAGIGWLVYRIVTMYPLERGVLQASLILLIGGLTSNRGAYTLTGLRDRANELAAQTVDIGLACALSGILVGATLITGWGVQIATVIFALGAQSLLLAMVATMLVTLVLGMGTPGVAAYIITASIVALPMADLGLPILGVHLFIFYFSNFAGITPPVALTAFAAAGLAKSDPFRTGMLAMVMALPTYIIAYAMVLRPELLMQGPFGPTVYAFATTALGGAAFAVGAAGALVGALSWPMRAIAMAAGLALIDNGTLTDAVGLAAVTAIAVAQFLAGRRAVAPRRDRVPSGR